MAELINPKADVFLGLNNALDPCSYEYEEGSAWKSDNSRIDESGRWAEQAALSACSSPPAEQACPITGGTHMKNLAVQGTDKIVTQIPTDCSVDVGPNKYLYATRTSWGGGDSERIQKAAGDVGQLAPPIIAAAGRPVETGTDALTRMQDGTYYYIFTTYDLTYERESLPSIVYPATYNSTDGGHIEMQVPDPGAGYEVRIYRSRRTYATESAYNPTNIFFYIDTIPTGLPDDPYTHIDYMNDEEIPRYEYEGRGMPPPKTIDYLAGYNNRMLYFKGNVLYWSSAGRPEEVAQNYILSYWDDTGTPAYDLSAIIDQGSSTVRFTTAINHTFAVNDYVQITRTDGWNGLYKVTAETNTTFDATYTGSAPDNETQGIACLHKYTVTNRPLLSMGNYAEAKYEISELEGQTVKATFLRDGRLWVCTDGMMGYMETDRRLETYRLRVLRRGIGAVNDKVIAHTPYGVFGVDRRGIWLLDNVGRIRRLSDGIIDIATSGKSTTLSQAYVSDSFGVWLPTLEEYWWSIQTDSTAVTAISGNGTWATVTATAHGYLTNDIVRINDSTNFDGPDYVITKIDANSFKFPHATVASDSGLSATATKYIQIVYQANKDLFVGPYSHTIIGGTSFVSTGGAQAYINDDTGTGRDGVVPSSPTMPQILQFWFGQSNLSAVKDNVQMEVLYASITSGKTVAAKIYQNKIASTTDATTSGSHSHTSANLVGKAVGQGSGRMFMLEFTIPYDCAAPILATTYKEHAVPWTEKANR